METIVKNNFKNMKKIKLNYILIPLVVVLVSVVGSYFTSSGMDWYNTLKLPSFTPPGSFIGMVWTIIFILSAIATLLIWNKTVHDKKFKIIIIVLILNAVLNVLWSWLFFYQGLIFVAIIEMIILEISTLLIIILNWRKQILSSILLMPYAGWVIFATYLAYMIWSLNK